MTRLRGGLVCGLTLLFTGLATAVTAQTPDSAPALLAHQVPLLLDGAGTAWLGTSTALVLLMTLPGLALFYGGMVRRKNVIATITQSVGVFAVVSLVWFLAGYSIAFGKAGGLGGYDGDTVNRLIGQKVVMPNAQTSCSVPAEVKRIAGEHMMGFVYAYGPEANFAFPVRPANPKTPWKPKWTAKVRYRSIANFMTGMPDMPQMGGVDDGDEREDRPSRQQPRPKQCKPKLGGLLRGALTGSSAC